MALNESIQPEHGIQSPVHLPKHATDSSLHIHRTYANTTFHIEGIQKIMRSINPNDTMISADIIKAVKETAHDRLRASRDTNIEARTIW